MDRGLRYAAALTNTEATPEFFEALADLDEADLEGFVKLVFNPTDNMPGLHAGQVRYDTQNTGQVNFLLPGNSWGKTEFITRHSLHQAWFKKGHHWPYEDAHAWLTTQDKTLIASFNYSVAEESFDRYQHYRASNPRFSALLTTINKHDSEVILTNGATLKWGSLDGQGRLVEAIRFNRIYIDEVGHIPDLSYTYDSILYPRTMGVSGVIHLFGTPKAHSDPYLLEIYEKGKDGGDGFYYSQSGAVFENEFWPESERERILANPRYVVGWVDCKEGGKPECDSPICFEREDGTPRHAKLTPMGRQVILGAFIIEGGLFFNKHHIRRMFDWPEEWPTANWLGDDLMWLEPVPGRMYAGAWDLGGNKLRDKNRRKRGSDATVGIVIDYSTRPWRIVRFDYIRGGDADWEQKYAVMQEVYHKYQLPYTCIDATGQQDSVSEALEKRGLEVESIYFGGASSKKIDMLRNLQVVTEFEYPEDNGAVTKGLLRSPPLPILKQELERYALPDENIQQDCIMALAMVVYDISQYELPDAVAGDVF